MCMNVFVLQLQMRSLSKLNAFCTCLGVNLDMDSTVYTFVTVQRSRGCSFLGGDKEPLSILAKYGDLYILSANIFDRLDGHAILSCYFVLLVIYKNYS